MLATTLAVPITVVNLLDAERDWFKSCVGIQQTQSPVVTSFGEAFFHTARDLVVVEDTRSLAGAAVELIGRRQPP